MDKLKAYQAFLAQLKSGKKVSYFFDIDMDWVEYHGRYEEKYNDWIEGVSERFIDGDDGRAWIEISWKYYKTKKEFRCYLSSDIEAKEQIGLYEDEEAFRSLFVDIDDSDDEDDDDDISDNQSYLNIPRIRI